MTLTTPVIRQGVSMLYTFELRIDEDGLMTVVATSAQAAPEAKGLVEPRGAAQTFLNQGADLAAEDGMQAAGAASLVPGTHFSLFAATSGGYSRYHTGSHVDVHGSSLITGVAWKPDIEYGKLLLAPFFEAGWGAYNSYNSLSGNYVHGKGNISYYGGGLLARYDMPSGLYLEGSGRVGKVRTEYASSTLRDAYNQQAAYDINTAYYGAHIGLGALWNLTERASLDTYTKYLWTHQEGKSTKVCGDTIQFKQMNSHRLRVGGRFSYTIYEYISPYIGAAWEREFDGRARASVYGHKIRTPDLTGDTGVGELGLNLKPSKELPLAFDLGVQGFVGKREGVTGSLQIRFEF